MNERFLVNGRGALQSHKVGVPYKTRGPISLVYEIVCAECQIRNKHKHSLLFLPAYVAAMNDV